MKKNKVLRIASVLLIVTLLSTCAISGTFAKYVTKAEGQDSARVAKWGIQIGMNADSAFDNMYDTHDESATVISTERVVAPGTNHEGALNATIEGKPEVAYQLRLKLDVLSDVILPARTDYVDYTVYPYNQTFEITQPYTPVKFNINFIGSIGSTSLNTSIATLTGRDGISLTDFAQRVSSNRPIASTVGGYGISIDNGELVFTLPAGVEVKGTFTLDWAWDFEVNDQADTFLGQAAAGVATLPAGASDTLSYAFTATAVQID